MKPRVRIINHRRVRDGEEEQESGNLPFAQRQALAEALTHAKRAVGIIPSDVATKVQLGTARRAVAHAQQELVVAARLLGKE